MIAPATLPDFATLDRRIADPLAALRVARATRVRCMSPASVRTEEHAESHLNGLLELRYSAQRR